MTNAVAIRQVPEWMPWSGNPEAPIVVICDAPTLAQWRHGVPIGGKPFDLFADKAVMYGLVKDDFAFVSPCAPIPELVEGSEKREKAFVDQYREALRRTVDRFEHAKVYVYLGKTAGYALTAKTVKITKQRGVVRKVDGLPIPVLPLLSPNHVLRRPENMELFEADMNMLRILREGGWQVDAAANAVEEVHYEWRDDISDILDLHPGSMSIDTEGVGLKWYLPETRLLTAQFAFKEAHAIVIPMSRWPQSQYPDISDRRLANLKRQFRLLAEDPSIKKCGHNIKFDHHMIRRAGIEIRGWTIDTQLMAFNADENMQEKSQDECVRRWVPEMAGYADAFNMDPIHVGKSRMDLVPPDQMLSYGGGDADANLRLAKRLSTLVRQDERQWNCYRRVQFPAMRAFMDVVEPAGILINTNELAHLQTTLTEQAETEYRELIDMVPAAVKRKHLATMKKGETPADVLNFGRASFMQDIMFSPEGFNLTPLVYTKTTAKLSDAEKIPSVSTKTHLPYFDDHPFVPKLIRFQQLAKLQNTYVGVAARVERVVQKLTVVDTNGEAQEIEREREVIHAPTGFWKYIDGTGYIHPSFMLHRTVTGRTASADPNGQNFPKRGPLAKAYRKIFVARPGYTYVECDLSQAELRIAAWMAHEPTMLKIYQENGDIHMATAVIVSGLSQEAFNKLTKEKQKEFRQKAKAVNFGFLYGMGWRKFMAYAKTDYGVLFTEKEAKAVRAAFFRKYRRLEPWHMAMREFVREHGYVRSLHGAKRNLPNIYSVEEYIRSECERQAINSPVQRFGSDLGLMALGRLCRDCDPDLLRPVAFIHDALVIEVRNDYLQQGMKAIKFYMQSCPLENWFGIRPPLPIVADVSQGVNLAEMKEEEGVPAEAPEWWNWALDGYNEPPQDVVYQTVAMSV